MRPRQRPSFTTASDQMPSMKKSSLATRFGECAPKARHAGRSPITAVRSIPRQGRAGFRREQSPVSPRGQERRRPAQFEREVTGEPNPATRSPHRKRRACGWAGSPRSAAASRNAKLVIEQSGSGDPCAIYYGAILKLRRCTTLGGDLAAAGVVDRTPHTAAGGSSLWRPTGYSWCALPHV